MSKITSSNIEQRMRRHKDRGKIIAVVASTGILIAASFGVQAIAESNPVQHAQLLLTTSDGEASTTSNPFMKTASWGGGGGGWFGRGHGRHRGDRFANMSDEQVEKRITRMVKHLAIEIDATDDQTAKITTLLTAIAKDMRPLRKEFRAAGDEAKKLLLAEQIDRAALEKLRAERLAKVDEVSRQMMNAMADVADVLTLEQRKVVHERIDQMRRWKRGWRRG